MIRMLVGVLVAISLVGVRAAQEQQQPVFRGGSEAVPVFVTVTDGSGRLVTTLNQDAFEVRDEGKPQPITLFDNSPRAIRLIVMLDVSGSMVGNLPLLRAGTVQLVKYLRADDSARIGTFGNEIVISPTFTRSANELLATLPSEINPSAPTPLWRAMDQAMAAFAGHTDDARHVVVVLSDGQDSGLINFRDKFITQADIGTRARREDVMIYGIGMRSTNSRPVGLGPGGLQAALTAGQPDPGLARVAEESGGGYLEVRFGDDLGQAFAQVAEELHSQYLLGFDPPKRDGKTHDVEVKVKERGLKVRARKSYVAPKEG